MILESKLNHMSLEELEMIDPDPIKPLLHYLLNFHEEAEVIARRIANQQAEKATYTSNIIGVSYDKYNETWLFKRTINGERKMLKSSVWQHVVEEAAIDFAKKNNLQIYR